MRFDYLNGTFQKCAGILGDLRMGINKVIKLYQIFVYERGAQVKAIMCLGLCLGF
jgi:hypothetical protein